MKKIRKRVVCILLSVTMMLGMLTPVTAFQDQTNQDGIGIMINGEMLTFTDAKPVNQDGRVLVPLRAIFETLGATVNFDEATNTVKAVLEEKTLFFVIGSKQVKVVEKGVAQTIDLDTAAYIDQETGRTYIPIRFTAESFGYNVSWDGGKNTVILLDIDKLTENLDSKFSIFNLVMQSEAERAKIPMKVTGDIDYRIDIKESGESIPVEIDMTADISAVEFMTDMEMSMNVSIDFDKMLSNLPEAQKEVMAPVFEQYKSIPATIKMDGENGVMYMRSDIFNLSPIPLPDGRMIDGSVWLKIDLNVLGQMSDNSLKLDYSAFVKNYRQYNSMEGILNLILKSQSSYTVDSYQDIKAAIVFIETLFGDGAFTERVSFDFDTYMLTIGKEELKNAAEVAYPLASEATRRQFSDVMYALNHSNLFDNLLLVDASYIIENSKVRSCDINASVDLTGATQGKVPAKLTMQITQKTPKNQSMTMDMTLADLITFYMSVNMIREETSQKPVVTVPKEETVIDYMEMLSLLTVR